MFPKKNNLTLATDNQGNHLLDYLSNIDNFNTRETDLTMLEVYGLQWMNEQGIKTKRIVKF